MITSPPPFSPSDYVLGYALCGSFCTHRRSLATLEALVSAGYRVVPIVSECVYATDTRFGRAKDLCGALERLCGNPVLHTVTQTEPIGPEGILSLLIVAPCTGNTAAKLACGITDTAVTMALKAQLRADRPVLLALSSNDALSGNLGNLRTLARRPHITLCPARRDDPVKKPYSLVPRFEKIPVLTQRILREAPAVPPGAIPAFFEKTGGL